MKTVIVREIISLVLHPSAPAPSTSTSVSTSANKHLTGVTPSKPKPKTVDKQSGNAHARYYATVTFNQIVLTPGDREVALKLIDVYFEMFKELLGEGVDVVEDEMDLKGDSKPKEFKTDKGGRIRDGGKGKNNRKGKGKLKEIKGAAGFTEVEDAHSRLISAILTGINRALPFAKVEAGDAA
jgi:ribosome biogenesis protein MAK21